MNGICVLYLLCGAFIIDRNYNYYNFKCYTLSTFIRLFGNGFYNSAPRIQRSAVTSPLRVVPLLVTLRVDYSAMLQIYGLNFKSYSLSLKLGFFLLILWLFKY